MIDWLILWFNIIWQIFCAFVRTWMMNVWSIQQSLLCSGLTCWAGFFNIQIRAEIKLFPIAKSMKIFLNFLFNFPKPGVDCNQYDMSSLILLNKERFCISTKWLDIIWYPESVYEVACLSVCPSPIFRNVPKIPFPCFWSFLRKVSIKGLV